MKSSANEIHDRRQRLLRYLKRHGESSIDDLGNSLEVSSMTIRRDCHALADMGLITRRLGVISLIDNSGANGNTAIQAIKKCLGAEAAKLIGPGDLVFINSSSTALNAIPPLLKQNGVIVTNNGNAVKFVEDSDLGSLIMCGGRINSRHIMQGDIANYSFTSMRSDWGIIGCAGLSIEHGISSPYLTEATVNKAIVNNSHKLIVVADYRKIDRVSNFTIGRVNDIDVLITDTFAPVQVLSALQKSGTQVIQITAPQQA